MDGCTLFLTFPAPYPSIVTSLVQGLNVATPSVTDEDDMDETPIPFQFQLTMKDWKKGEWTCANVEGGD